MPLAESDIENEQSNMKKPKRRRGIVLLIILLALVLLVAILLYDSNTRLVLTEYELSYAKLPAAFDGFRIVFLTDTHATEFGKNNERLLSMVKGAHPDIIAVGGDLIDHDKFPPLETQQEIAEALIDALMPIAPVCFVTGNHEWDSGGIWQLMSMLSERGVQVLRNKHIVLEAGGETIVLAGTDDPNGPADMIKPADFVERVRAAEGDRFIIMLEHRNFNLQLYSGLGVDLILCGHAHGGIIRLPFTDGLIGPNRDWFPTHTSGVYSMGDTNMVVSRGVGNHTGWPRFLNNPEVVVIELRIEN